MFDIMRGNYCRVCGKYILEYSTQFILRTEFRNTRTHIDCLTSEKIDEERAINSKLQKISLKVDISEEEKKYFSDLVQWEKDSKANNLNGELIKSC